MFPVDLCVTSVRTCDFNLGCQTCDCSAVNCCYHATQLSEQCCVFSLAHVFTVWIILLWKQHELIKAQHRLTGLDGAVSALRGFNKLIFNNCVVICDGGSAAVCVWASVSVTADVSRQVLAGQRSESVWTDRVTQTLRGPSVTSLSVTLQHREPSAPLQL